jgi:hypothetical protein
MTLGERTRMTDLGLVYRDGEWAHGLMCAKCPHVFREGERFSTLLYAFSDDMPMALVTCLGCATGEPTRGNESAHQVPPA